MIATTVVKNPMREMKIDTGIRYGIRYGYNALSQITYFKKE